MKKIFAILSNFVTNQSKLILIILLVPIIAEIINGSTSLSKFLEAPFLTFLLIFLPYSFLIIILYYLKSKCSLSNTLLLLPIAGLVIEGLIVLSFFDISFEPLVHLAGVGVLFGTQWPWTISLIMSHAMTSFLIPIAIADIFIKKEIKVNKNILYISIIFLTCIFLFHLIIESQKFLVFTPQIVGTFVTIIAIVYLSLKYNIKPSITRVVSSKVFFLVGFMFVPINWISSFLLIKTIGLYTVYIQILFGVLYIYFLWSQFFNPKTQDNKKIYFIIGYLLPHIIILSILGLKNIQQGLAALLGLVLVIFLFLKLKHSSDNIQINNKHENISAIH